MQPGLLHGLGHALGVLGQLGERDVGVDHLEAGRLDRRPGTDGGATGPGPRAMKARSALWPSTATVTTWSPSASAFWTAAEMAAASASGVDPTEQVHHPEPDGGGDGVDHGVEPTAPDPEDAVPAAPRAPTPPWPRDRSCARLQHVPCWSSCGNTLSVILRPRTPPSPPPVARTARYRLDEAWSVTRPRCSSTHRPTSDGWAWSSPSTSPSTGSTGATCPRVWSCTSPARRTCAATRACTWPARAANPAWWPAAPARCSAWPPTRRCTPAPRAASCGAWRARPNCAQAMVEAGCANPVTSSGAAMARPPPGRSTTRRRHHPLLGSAHPGPGASSSRTPDSRSPRLTTSGSTGASPR